MKKKRVMKIGSRELAFFSGINYGTKNTALIPLCVQ